MNANPRCFASHLGLYACLPRWLSGAVAAVKEGTWPLRGARRADGGVVVVDGEGPTDPPKPYEVLADGVAGLALSGAFTKGWSKFGGTLSTAWARRAIRAAVADPKVHSILLTIDSPGGQVNGTNDLALDVKAASEVKPVVAFIEDMGASAAYWVASQAGKVYTNPTGEIGSIGVYAVIEDTSKMASEMGVVVHVLRSAPMKGAGEPGTPITEEILARWQEPVDAIAAIFGKAVKDGRGMTRDGLAAVSTGDTWIGQQAADLGLVDGVKTLDAVLAGMRPPKSRKRADIADALTRLAEAG